jgi:hypothetical protein
MKETTITKGNGTTHRLINEEFITNDNLQKGSCSKFG